MCVCIYYYIYLYVLTFQDSDILKLSNLLNAETNQNASVSNFMVNFYVTIRMVKKNVRFNLTAFIKKESNILHSNVASLFC